MTEINLVKQLLLVYGYNLEFYNLSAKNIDEAEKLESALKYTLPLGKVTNLKTQEKGGFRTKKDAQTALREAMTEYDQCGNVFKASEISVNDYFTYWYNTYVLTNCKPSTQVYYKRIINNHIIPPFEKYKLKQLTSDALQQFLNVKKRDGFSKNSLSNFYGVLSGALKYAVYPAQYIKANHWLIY